MLRGEFSSVTLRAHEVSLSIPSTQPVVAYVGACPRCRWVMRLYRRIGGQCCCRTCVAATRAQPCARCGVVREAAIRDEAGRPLCPYCLITDPASHEVCAGCGRRRPVSVRSPDGPLCPACRPVKTMTCSICGRDAVCYLSKTTGQPWCEAYKQRWARCSRCGSTARVRGGTRNEPLCAPAPAPTRDSGAPALAAGRPGGSTTAGAPAAPSSSGCVNCWATKPAASVPACKPSTTPSPPLSGPPPSRRG